MKNLLTNETLSEQTLIPQDRLQERVSELGREISETYAGRELTLVPILRGAFVFAADLLREITIPVAVDFIAITSYAGQAGVVRLTKDLDASIAGRDVIMVEDIVDTGLTANYLLQNLRRRNPASVALCTLLDRPARRIIELSIAYRGFEIPDLFVVGYGMDYQQRYRNLPYITELRTGQLTRPPDSKNGS